MSKSSYLPIEPYNNDILNEAALKGKLAEIIIAQMFEKLGYTVFRSGMEYSMPGFGRKGVEPYKGKVANLIRKMPDLIIVKEDEDPVFVEVKYSEMGSYKFREHYPNGYQFPEACFVLVTPELIRIQKASELHNGKGFVFFTHFQGLETNDKIVGRYSTFCKKLFGRNKNTKTIS